MDCVYIYICDQTVILFTCVSRWTVYVFKYVNKLTIYFYWIVVRFTSVYLAVPNSNEVAVCHATLTVNMFISTNIITQDNYNCSLCNVQDVWA